ncbi:MAG: 3-phosphoshikimate 1-carboxyvinyltransferase [Bacteroidetes bacterium RIFCSPLOWO2_12_FULL_35_15]|nr:MAG: 3-phosphoshikimate 1-carboxyvinyltransferase [Bacteroidetes bacterium RIFCSPLOWO2_12_FULL_35_15]
MKYRISHPTKKLSGSLTLTASKSESNRALIIQALCRERFEIKNLALAQDTQTLQQILERSINDPYSSVPYNVGAGGTTMRFLTAYFSTKLGTHILTGSERMKKRPIGILVDALRQLGANIEYMEEEGFPPLKITGKSLIGGEIEMDGNVSSQFISALLLISPELRNGLVIKFNGAVTSRPYINMTLNIMEEFRVYGMWHDCYVSVSKQVYHRKSETDYEYEVEADWSSASYWYAAAALSKEADLTIKGLRNPSIQGDAIVENIFPFFGVKTEYTDEGVRLTKIRVKDEHFGFDFSDCPDLAQTIAVVASALKIPAFFNGLHTLRIKETDRIQALKNELHKFGVEIEIVSDNAIKINPSAFCNTDSAIKTYEDHRMAMAFATLAMQVDSIIIEDPSVVKKSYPDFWTDLKSLGFVVEEI